MRAATTIAVFLALTLTLLAAAPNTLRLGFPALALVAAGLLFRQSRTAYITFCCWLWFLSPLLRRLVDFRTEFVATSPLLLAPLLASAVSGVLLIRHIRTLSKPAAVPFAAAFAGIFFGTVYGLTRYGPVDVARGVINWLPPVFFALFLYRERDRLTAYRAAITGSLLWGTLLMGAYGVLQFFMLPAWDESWMRGLNNGAFGQPEPRELRVFSTMNAPATFASYLMAGLLLAFAVLIDRAVPRSRTRLLAALAAPIGLLALALTTSRSLWLGLAAGVLYLAFALPARARVRVIAFVLIACAAAGVATQLPGIHEVVATRLKSFSSGTSDISASARIDGHTDALARLATEPLGEGMGSTDVDHATDGSDDRLGPHDSTLLELLYALGGPGTLIYAIGLGFGLSRIFLSGRLSHTAPDPVASAYRAIVLALFAQCLLTSILIGVPGFLLWACFSVALAGVPHDRRRAQLEADRERNPLDAMTT